MRSAWAADSGESNVTVQNTCTDTSKRYSLCNFLQLLGRGIAFVSELLTACEDTPCASTYLVWDFV